MFALQGRALPDCRLFASMDLEDACGRISEVMQPHVLRPLSRVAATPAHMDFLRLPQMGIGAIHLGHASVRVDRIADYHLIIFCGRGSGRVETPEGVIEVDAQRGVCLAPGEALVGDFSAECEQLVFRIDTGLMRQVAGAPAVRLPSSISAARPELSSWARTVAMVLGNAQSISLLRQDRRMAQAYQQMFVGALLAGQEDLAGGDDGPEPALVRRAKAFIAERYDQPITLTDIAEAARAPVRTLLHNFRRFCGVSPMIYLRDLRLDVARRQLKSPAAASATVAGIAMESGFSHLGRFSQSYHARFGEHPSQTRRS